MTTVETLDGSEAPPDSPNQMELEYCLAHSHGLTHGLFVSDRRPRVNPRPFVFLYNYLHLFAAIGNAKEVLAEVKGAQRNKRRKDELDD